MKHLIIRADSTSRIGTGHVMRCIALGQAWQDSGGEVAFISHCESEALRNRIAEEGFQFFYIENPHPHSDDLSHTLKYMQKFSSTTHDPLPSDQWVVIDGYNFDAEYQKRIKEAGYKILWIDDYGHADHYSADLILNQNITANESFYTHRESYTQLLLGTRYVLLRREFKKWQGWQHEIHDIARKVLVTLGGGDPDNVTLKVIKALKQIDITGIKAKIVVGPANPNLASLENEIVNHPNFQLIMDASNMPELMAWADIAISAGGTTCWEIALLGLPNMIMFLAENQRPTAEKLYEEGAVLSLGWYNKLLVTDLIQNIKYLLLSHKCRKEFSIKSRQIVDGLGAQRVCHEIM